MKSIRKEDYYKLNNYFNDFINEDNIQIQNRDINFSQNQEQEQEIKYYYNGNIYFENNINILNVSQNKTILNIPYKIGIHGLLLIGLKRENNKLVFENFNSQENESNIYFKGWFVSKNNGYAFYDYSNYYGLSDSDYVFVLLDEIFNYKKSGETIIDKSVTTFFSEYPEFSIVKDENYNVAQQPIIAYRYTDNPEMEYYLGPLKNFNLEKSDTYIYFTDYENSRNKCTNIIRYALFLGNSIVLDDYNIDSFSINDYNSMYNLKTQMWQIKDERNCSTISIDCCLSS